MSIYLLPVVFLITMHGIRATPWNYREDILYNYYLGSANSGYRTSAGLKYKIFDNNIGYIRYESFSAGVGDGNLDEVL